MAGRPRFHTTTSRAPRTPRTPGVPSSHLATTLEMQQALMAMQQALARRSPASRVPTSATPEKCEAEMSTASFRSWRRSAECWVRLNQWGAPEAVLHIRLLCTPALQRTLDTRYTMLQWEALSTTEALDAIENLVLKGTNQAAVWSTFFSSRQAPGESVSDFFRQCSQTAADCGFQCPSCGDDLAEYMLLRKLMGGLSDPVMKREVFQLCKQFTSVDKLRTFCLTFESAARDANFGGSFTREVAGAELDAPLPDVAQEVVAGAHRHPAPASVRTRPPANRPHTPVEKPCGNCGGTHAPGRVHCPARSLNCYKCGKPGHVEKMCRSGGRRSTTPGLEAAVSVPQLTSGAVLVAGTAPCPHPTLHVSVTSGGRATCEVMAVADTGAQVCVGGRGLLTSLSLRPTQLKRRAGLRDIANMPLQLLGSAVCTISHGGRSSTQEICFVDSARHLFLSLSTCMELGLVPRDFPRHTQVAAGASQAPPARQPGLTEAPTRPAAIPLPPLEENVGRLEEWLLRHFSSSTFNVGRCPLPVMAGEPHRIHLLPDAVPHTCHTPAPVPRHWEAEVKKQLDEEVRMGVIEPVPAGEATRWCARMVVVAKKSGQPRRTVDYQKLNAVCLRETHHTPTPFDMVAAIPAHTFKTVADAHWGFHQVELEEESRKLTTFITPWGRYRYRRTPMGHCAAPDAYTKRFDDALVDIQRKFKCIDDTLLHDESVEGAFWHAYELLEACARQGITLKPEKFRFGRREVEFVGFHVGWESYKPTDERLAAVRDFSMPAKPTLTDIRSWFGFVNQLAPFIATAPIMEPFRDLLKRPQGKRVYWDEHLQEKFQQAKETVCQLAKDGLAFYDRSRPTIAMTDFSKEGIGFVVLQQHCGCGTAEAPFCCRSGWRLALCGSRHLSAAEAGYASVEGEALAVVWCLRKARLFLLGCPNLVLVTDHRPLVRLLGDRALKDIVNPRLFALKEKTLQYRFAVKYLSGKRNCAADFLSRYPALRTSPDSCDENLAVDLEVATAAATTAALTDNGCITLDEASVTSAAADDPVYQLLVAKVLTGDWSPQRSREVACLRQFYGVRDRLSVSQGLVTYTFDQGSVRLVIPEPLRQQVATHLHAGHQGLDSMLRRARQSVYWPGMDGDLQHLRSTCSACNAHAPSQSPEPLVITPPPEYPFQCTVTDLFQLEGNTYLVYADRLTGWLEIGHLPSSASSSKLMAHFRRFFARWGAPEEVSTDGGTNLVSEEMQDFFRRWGVRVRVSSAHYPQSNGRAEAAVKSAKRMLRLNIGPTGSLDTDKLSAALLQYHNTPLRGADSSPAQLATGRHLRDGVPTARCNYKVDQHWRRALRRRELAMARSGDERVERQGPVRTLEPLSPGSRVWVQNQMTKVWDRSGVVAEALPHRQYTVRLDGSGRLSLRNRRHLRVKRGATLASPAPSHAGPTPATSPTPQPRQSTPSRPRRTSRRPQWLADYDESSPP